MSARSLSLGYEGPQRKRPRRVTTAPVSDITLLRRMLQASHPDLVMFAAVLDRVSRTSERESSVYTAARRRYGELTQEP